MDKEKSIATVKQIYVNVVAKDLDGVFNMLTDDIRWESPFTPDIPHTKPRKGKHEVKDWIMEMAAELTYNQVTPQEFYTDKDAVIVKGFLREKQTRPEKLLNRIGYTSGSFVTAKFSTIRPFGIPTT